MMKPILLKYKNDGNQTEYIVVNQVTKLTDLTVGGDGNLNTKIDFVGGTSVQVKQKIEDFIKYFDIIEVSNQ